MHIINHPTGNYRFLSGIAPYSAGVVALPGYEIVRVTLHEPIPYRVGFGLIDRLIAGAGRPVQALCAVELRLPAPLSFQGFIEFNVDYRQLLAERALLVGEANPDCAHQCCAGPACAERAIALRIFVHSPHK